MEPSELGESNDDVWGKRLCRADGSAQVGPRRVKSRIWNAAVSGSDSESGSLGQEL